MSQKRLDHVGIVVRDLEATIAFYTSVVGLELKNRLTHTNGVIQLAFLGFNGSNETEVELIQGYSDTLPAEGTVHHLQSARTTLKRNMPGFKDLTFLTWTKS